MIVVDASVIVELFINGKLADSMRQTLAARSDSLIAPHLLNVEVMSALTSLCASSRVDSHRAKELVAAVAALPVVRYPHTPLRPLHKRWLPTAGSPGRGEAAYCSKAQLSRLPKPS